eukprot:8841703-Pyramimonas_sp.AAC.2
MLGTNLERFGKCGEPNKVVTNLIFFGRVDCNGWAQKGVCITQFPRGRACDGDPLTLTEDFTTGHRTRGIQVAQLQIELALGAL